MECRTDTFKSIPTHQPNRVPQEARPPGCVTYYIEGLAYSNIVVNEWTLSFGFDSLKKVQEMMLGVGNKEREGSISI